MLNDGTFNILERLDVISDVLQILNYAENKQQTSNDRIMKELQHQNAEYLEKIIEQNKEIIRLLKGDN